jgi:hypothetical protein
LKKYIRWILVPVLIFCTCLNIYAAYPASTDHGCFKPEEGVLLEGTLFGAPSWSGGSGDSYERAWDGDPYTFYDPQVGASDASYTGIETDEPYVITEVRILPREGWLNRFEGARIQGSNDGVEWFTVWESRIPAKEWKYACYTGQRIDCPEEGYTMFRYVNLHEHGDVAEIELYGMPVTDEEAERLAAESAAESEKLEAVLLEREEIAKHVMTAPSSGDPMTIIIVLIVVSGVLFAAMTILSHIQKNKKK